MRNIVILSSPTEEFLTLTEVKNYLKISVDDDDALIADLIKEARFEVQNYLNLLIGTHSVQEDIFYENLNDLISLSHNPAQSIESISWFTKSGIENEITDYQSWLGKYSYIKLFDSALSMIDWYDFAYLRIIYTAGLTPNEVIKTAMLKLIAFHYEYRVSKPQASEFDVGAANEALEMLRPLRRMVW